MMLTELFGPVAVRTAQKALTTALLVVAALVHTAAYTAPTARFEREVVSLSDSDTVTVLTIWRCQVYFLVGQRNRWVIPRISEPG